MSISKGMLIVLLGIMVIGVACGGQGGEKETTTELATESYLPDDAEGVSKVSDVRKFEGEALYEYINGGAEMYHLYGFIEVVTADYKLGETEVVADIFKFDTPAHGYGLYSSLRPWEPVSAGLGTESFIGETTINAVKGQYLIRLTGYEASDETSTAMRSVAGAIEQALPGNSSMPEAYSLFPAEGRIPATAKMLAQSYLGQRFLTEVYTANYEVGTDTVTLFLSEDSSGAKVSIWFSEAKPDQDQLTVLGYDTDRVFISSNPYYGDILTGNKNGYMLGVAGYKELHAAFVTEWLKTFDQQ